MPRAKYVAYATSLLVQHQFCCYCSFYGNSLKYTTINNNILLFSFDSNDDCVTYKPARFVYDCRCLNGGHSTMPCSVALAKEARNNIVDKCRSKRIAAIMLTVSDSDESSESSSSKDETSAMENSDGERTKFMLQ